MNLNKMLKKWSAFAHLLGMINTSIVLSLFFILIITPAGLIMRLFHKNIFFGPAKKAQWVKRSSEENLERQY